MYDSTFEGLMVHLLSGGSHHVATPVETPYDAYLREAWAPYDRFLTQTYKHVDDQG